jgi:hypothetical protein
MPRHNMPDVGLLLNVFTPLVTYDMHVIRSAWAIARYFEQGAIIRRRTMLWEMCIERIVTCALEFIFCSAPGLWMLQ